MMRAAAKNHGSVAVVSTPTDYGVRARRDADAGGVSAETRRSSRAGGLRAHRRRTTPRSRTGSPRAIRCPSGCCSTSSRSTRPALRREPAPGRGLLPRDAARGATCSRWSPSTRASRSPTTTCSTSTPRSRMVEEFSLPACAIVKHGNPCGVSLGATIEEAYERAHAADPASAYGGIIALNRAGAGDARGHARRALHRGAARDRRSRPRWSRRCAAKSTRVLDSQERRRVTPGEREYRRVIGGLLVQDRDNESEDRSVMQVASAETPSEAQWGDLLFAWRVAKHVHSNAIVLARGLATVGVGAGQMIARRRRRASRSRRRGERGQGARARLRCLLPVRRRHLACRSTRGVSAIIQPGGSDARRRGHRRRRRGRHRDGLDRPPPLPALTGMQTASAVHPERPIHGFWR